MSYFYEREIREALGDKRYNHSLNVADMCFQLANIHGEDPEKAYMAGILHDIRKESDPEILKKETAMSDLSPDPVELVSKPLWHAISGAYYVRNVLGVIDPDILNAIRYHTVARACMSKLEKIVYLGDLISKDRNYPEIETYRELAFSNLDKAMYHSVKWAILETVNKNEKIPVCTLEAYNFYNLNK